MSLLVKGSLPCGCQSPLASGCGCDPSPMNLTMPSCLQTLAFGEVLNRSIKRVTLQIDLQTLAFGDWFDQSLKKASFQTLAVDEVACCVETWSSGRGLATGCAPLAFHCPFRAAVCPFYRPGRRSADSVPGG